MFEGLLQRVFAHETKMYTLTHLNLPMSWTNVEMERANSQLWAGIKTSSKAYLLWAPLCVPPPLPITSTTVRILNQLSILNPGSESSMMLRTSRIFHFGGWWFSEGAVLFCTCAEVWTATERSWWKWIGGQRAGDEVKSAGGLWFSTRVSAMRTCLCVWIPGTWLWMRLSKPRGCSNLEQLSPARHPKPSHIYL